MKEIQLSAAMRLKMSLAAAKPTVVPSKRTAFQERELRTGLVSGRQPLTFPSIRQLAELQPSIYIGNSMLMFEEPKVPIELREAFGSVFRMIAQRYKDAFVSARVGLDSGGMIEFTLTARQRESVLRPDIIDFAASATGHKIRPEQFGLHEGVLKVITNVAIPRVK